MKFRPRKKTALAIAAALATVAGAFPAWAQDVAIVTTRVVYPGETVEIGALKEVVLHRQPNPALSFVSEIEAVEGKVTRRTLLPGRFIPTDSVREPYVVETGSPVQVSFVQGGLTISTLALPLQPGAVGDMVRLRNMDSGAVFSGVVLADGTVRVGAS